MSYLGEEGFKEVKRRGSVRKGVAKETLFEDVVRGCTGRRPVTIFPGSKTSQSNVESFHNLVQTEFYEVENLSSDRLLLGRGRTYRGYFNHVRKNLWKGGKTPAMILAEAGGRVNPQALTLPPIRLETIPLGPLMRSQDGNHVPDLVTLRQIADDLVAVLYGDGTPRR